MCDEARAAERQWARQRLSRDFWSSLLGTRKCVRHIVDVCRTTISCRREADEAQHGVRQVGFRGANVHLSGSHARRARKGGTGWRRMGRR